MSDYEDYEESGEYVDYEEDEGAGAPYDQAAYGDYEQQQPYVEQNWAYDEGYDAPAAEEEQNDDADVQNAGASASAQVSGAYAQPNYYNNQNQYGAPSYAQEAHRQLSAAEPAHALNAEAEPQAASAFSLGSLSDALGGIGGLTSGGSGGGMGDIVGQIQKLAGGGESGGLSSLMSGGSGGFESMASNLISSAAHKFLNIDPATGAIIGAIAGNILFNLGGKQNSLSDIGKLVLDNVLSGKFKRKVDPFVSPTPGIKSFNLDFHRERDRCLRERVLFEDPEFSAADSSLYYSKPPKQRVEWRRPGQIVDDPQLIVGGQNRFDVVQGALGDCYLLAAAANLAQNDELFYRVVPPDQDFVQMYAGIFHFQFWRYGRWVDVVIDDRLPTNAHGELIYLHSAENNEFWSALLEKAYAKLYGSYEALEGGCTAEASEDLTGGLTEYIHLHKTPKEQTLALIVRGMQMNALFGCSIDADPNVKEAIQPNGLVRGHAYSITALNTVETSHGTETLLRIRNPWGNDTEFKGRWSDNSDEWRNVSHDQLQKLGFKSANDGEFWMSIDDFVREYEQLEICNLGPSVTDEIVAMTGVQNAPSSAWNEAMLDGAWSRAHGTAGGCRNNPTFAHNPQFGASFSVGNAQLDADGKATVIAAVLQKYRRELRSVGLDSLAIGFSVYEQPYGSRIDPRTLAHAEPIASNPVFINTREVTARFRCPPGHYVVVPSTFDPDEDGEFLLRIYSTGAVSSGEIR